MAQWEAARMLVARMRHEAENADLEFSFGDIGMTWIEQEDRVCAVTDSGLELYGSDVIFAAAALLWSALVEQAQILGEPDPLAAVGRLGVNLAHCEPGP